MQEKLVATLTNVNLWAAIIASIVIIALGYTLLKINWFKKEWKPALIGVVMKVALPALALVGFMKTTSIAQLKEQGIVLGIAFAFYILLCLVSWLWIRFMPNKTPKSVENASENTVLGQVSDTVTINESRYRAMVMWMLLIFGSTTFFGMPIIQSLYNKGGLIAANVWNIPYRIFLYSYCFMQMKGLKFDKENVKKSLKTTFLNPIVICTFVGLILWLTQLIPGAGVTTKDIDIIMKLENGNVIYAVEYSTFGNNFEKIYTGSDNLNYVFNNAKGIYVTTTVKPVGWFEWSTTMPYFYKFISILGSLCSPLIWLAIGMTLATSGIKEAARDKWVWIYSLIKMIVIPVIIFFIFWGLNHAEQVTKNVAIAMVIFAATPPATVAVGFAISEDKCARFASGASALSTLLAVVVMPIWIVICELAIK